MAVNTAQYQEILRKLGDDKTLVAVSKTKPSEDIQALYNLGQRDFGENYVQEVVDKQALLPGDIRWHFIGHLQSNKVKQIAPFVHLIHGVDSLKLLQEINKQACNAKRIIQVLLQVHIANEETKFGLGNDELDAIMQPEQLAGLENVSVKGLMGMASFTPDASIINNEFDYLQLLFNKYAQAAVPGSDFQWLSMGMSSDYTIALEHGSNMVRIGSLLFGERNKK